MMYVVFLLVGMLIGASVVLILKSFRREKELPVVVETDKAEISLQEMARLVPIHIFSDVNTLMVEHKVHVRLPDFHVAYQVLTKNERDLYFSNLIGIMGKDKRDFIRHIFDNYPGFSTQDVLLLLMSDMQFDNKTMARVMGLNPDALKKRKTRLKLKIQLASLKVRKEESL